MLLSSVTLIQPCFVKSERSGDEYRSWAISNESWDELFGHEQRATEDFMAERDDLPAAGPRAVLMTVRDLLHTDICSCGIRNRPESAKCPTSSSRTEHTKTHDCFVPDHPPQFRAQPRNAFKSSLRLTLQHDYGTASERVARSNLCVAFSVSRYIASYLIHAIANHCICVGLLARFLAHPQRQASALRERGGILGPSAQAVSASSYSTALAKLRTQMRAKS